MAFAVLVLLLRRRRGSLVGRSGAGAPNSWRTVVAADVRNGLLARRAWPGVAAASVLSTAGQVLTFLLAARVAGVSAPVGTLIPLAILALAAMSIPLNIAGWGPREGVAAWAFGAAGLGAAQGVTAAVVYGVLLFVGCLPGALVLLADRRPKPQDARRPDTVGASNRSATDG
jgi:hypothetical protein